MGAALAGLPQADPWGAAIEDTGGKTHLVSQATPVRGESGAAQPVAVSRAPAASTSRTRKGRRAPERSRAGRPPRLPPPRGADIARAALGFSAYVSGDDVYGAGILLDRQGHVLTCDHVVEGLEVIEVSFADGQARTAKVVDRDPQLDLALLEVEGAPGAPAQAASVATVRAGDDVFSMGSPRKMKFTLSRGMASYVGRPFDGVRYLQTDLPLNGGSSGGPIMNDQGQVVGVSSFVLKDSEGLSFALPIDYAYRRFAAWLDFPGEEAGLPGGPAFDAWLTASD